MHTRTNIQHTKDYPVRATKSVLRALLLAPCSSHDENGDVELRKRNRDWSRDRQRVACHLLRKSPEAPCASFSRAARRLALAAALPRTSGAGGFGGRRSPVGPWQVVEPGRDHPLSAGIESLVRKLIKCCEDGVARGLTRGHVAAPTARAARRRESGRRTASEAVSAAAKASQAWRADASNAGKK